MSDENYSRILSFGERVGVPTIILLVLLYGGYRLLTPLTETVVAFLGVQVELMAEIAKDVRETRDFVERDAGENKAMILQEVRRAITEHHSECCEVMKEIRANQRLEMYE